MLQEEAFNLLKMGENVFLTGEAGSGKTYLLNKYIQYLQENNVTVAVTASTGIAATHLQGTTLHSWSGIGVKDELSQKDLEKLLTKSRIKSNYKKTKVLIIDEISMLHKHQLDMVDKIARYVRCSDQPFGGLQVILCGDFFQLPPVGADSISEEKLFAFESAVWQTGNFHVCYLTEQHRQDDDPLRTILNDIRSGTAGEQTKVPLRTRYKKEPEGSTKPTKLYARNINVDVINDQALTKLSGQEHMFTMVCDGFNAIVDGLKKSCLALEQLKLKMGAEVMFIKNDILSRYVNGTRGVVVAFDKKEGWPVVKTYDDYMLTVTPEEWKYEDNGVVRATISQIPLRLAWAITIHKSQGMTLDAAEIDLSDAFEPGMGYVALSRVRSLNGLKLVGFNEMALKVHPKILQQDKTFRNSSRATINYLKTLSKNDMAAIQKETLVERFKGGAIKTTEKKKNALPKKSMNSTHDVTYEMLKEGVSLEAIALKRALSLGTIIHHLEKLISLKKIDHSDISHLKKHLLKKDFEIIMAELKTSQDGKLKPIYDKFAGKYPYASIQLVKLFI